MGFHFWRLGQVLHVSLNLFSSERNAKMWDLWNPLRWRQHVSSYNASMPRLRFNRNAVQLNSKKELATRQIFLAFTNIVINWDELRHWDIVETLPTYFVVSTWNYITN